MTRPSGIEGPRPGSARNEAVVFDGTGDAEEAGDDHDELFTLRIEGKTITAQSSRCWKARRQRHDACWEASAAWLRRQGRTCGLAGRERPFRAGAGVGNANRAAPAVGCQPHPTDTLQRAATTERPTIEQDSTQNGTKCPSE